MLVNGLLINAPGPTIMCVKDLNKDKKQKQNSRVCDVDGHFLKEVGISMIVS